MTVKRHEKTHFPESLSNRSGVLPLHKPVGPTSRETLDAVEGKLPGAKIGHAGTLDPLAEGVLPLMVNEATKLVRYLQNRPKKYRVRLRFDLRSSSHDLGEPHRRIDPGQPPDRETLLDVLDQYVGSIEQVPPRYSAVKSDGKRLHERSRQGESVDPDPRTVRSHEIRILDYSFPALVLEVTCGKGFYIRALARDLASDLNLEGGLVTSLVRTKYGPFTLEDSALLAAPGSWARCIMPPRKSVSAYHWVHCNAETITDVTNGKWIERSVQDVPTAMAIGPKNRLHAILNATRERGSEQWRPRRVLNRDNEGNGS